MVFCMKNESIDCHLTNEPDINVMEHIFNYEKSIIV